MASKAIRAILLGLLAGCGGRTFPVVGADSGSGDPAFDAAPPVESSTPWCGSCGATPCRVRPGQPRVLVSSPVEQQISAIAVSADTLYYGTYPNQSFGEIRAVPLAGGSSRLLVANVVVRALYLQGATLYFVSVNRSSPMANLVGIPAAGGPTKLAAQGNELEYVAFDASGIFFSDRIPGESASRIMHNDGNGSAPTPFVSLAGVLEGFTIDDTNMYWAEYVNGSGELLRRPLAGGDTTPLRASQEPITSPLSDGVDIDYVEGIATPDTCRSSVMTIAKGGGVPPRQISPGTSGADVMALVHDDKHVYWASSGTHGAIVRTEKGQTPEVIATDQLSAGDVVLGLADVYWIARAGAVYEVRTVPK